MNTLIPQMADFLKESEPAPGVPVTAVSDVLLALATSAIQQDPTQATIPPNVSDPAIIAAVQAAVAQVAVLNKTFTRVRVVRDLLPAGNTAADGAEAVAETFGPFIQRSGELVRYSTLRSGAFWGVTKLVPPNTTEDQLVIPAASTPDAADLRNWTLAPGTVWINSRFLVAGATGFTGLRIAGGKMQLAAGTFRFRSGIVIPAGSDWSLSVEPEAAPAPGAGSDGDALALTLPTRLDVSSSSAPRVTGAPVFSGFGSDLHFTFSGSPVLDGQQIDFPMVVAEPTFSIAGNASMVVMFSGEAKVTSAHWSLPISFTPLASLADAAHGGSLILDLSSGIEATLTGQQGGPSRLLFRSLKANARRIDIDAAQSSTGSRYDFDFWSTSSTSLHLDRLNPEFLFQSERGGIDTVAVVAGTIGTKWDLPCGADGQPFAFEGSVNVFSLFSSPTGLWVNINASASLPDPDPLHGVALENLYLVVKGPRKLFVLAPFDSPQLLTGIAILLFDVNVAVPTLPDPYAANLLLPDGQDLSANALGIRLSWADGATPTLRASLQQPVDFPEPEFDQPIDNDDKALLVQFYTYLGAQPGIQRVFGDAYFLLDMSSREHLLGVAFELPSGNPAELVDNRLAFPTLDVRLLMPPQVLWEPVRVESNPLVQVLKDEIVRFTSQGGPTLIGSNSVTLVPTLPEPVTAGILDAIRQNQNTAALFSLPFGLRVLASLASSAGVFFPGISAGPATELHEPVFDKLSAARQLRITAANNVPPNSPAGTLDPSRTLPGTMVQLQNLIDGNQSKLKSVMPLGLEAALNEQFATSIPLQQADLSGYGLSTFSHWILGSDGNGFIKAEFQVLNGRTAYEVLQFRSVLYECGARVVRTVILERRSSGRVFRTDTGWVAVDEGEFTRPIPFVKGAVRSLQNIRRIRITGPAIPLAGAAVEPVIFDADAVIDGHTGGPVPIYDRPGYIQIEASPQPPPNPAVFIPPQQPLAPLTDIQLKALFDLVGPIGGPIDCVTRLGGTLETQLSSIVSDVAMDDLAKTIGFAVAVVGSPKLPRAGQWNVMRINPVTHEVSPVDPRRGVPVVQVGVTYRFREPSDALRTPHIQHGLLMCTESSRVLFPQPFVSLVAPFGDMQFDLPPVMADPYSLVQSTGHFPRPEFALGLKEKAIFHISADNHWQIDVPEFHVDTTPSSNLMKGADWGISRGYLTVPPVVPPPAPGDPPPVIPPTTVMLAVDSAAAVALNVVVPRSNLNLDLPSPLDSILKIHTNYETVAGGFPKLDTPTLEFSGALQELTDILNSLSQLLNLPFEFDVTVTSSGGASPSFTVHMHLDFRIGKSPEERVDVGMGKFYGEFTVEGELEASLTGVNRALLSLEFQGDMQQGILPPLLYAGGLFRFSIELHDKGSPTIEMGLGVVFSIGGELIPGLIAVEATVHYGYTLIPEDLSPGAFIGLDAHAKLLDGLIGFSFGVEAMAKMRRKPDERGIVTIWAQIRVAASVQIAFFVDEDIDFTTQFQQDIPLAALSLIPGVGLLPAAASVL